jgi:hypothetical protein
MGVRTINVEKDGMYSAKKLQLLGVKSLFMCIFNMFKIVHTSSSQQQGM